MFDLKRTQEIIQSNHYTLQMRKLRLLTAIINNQGQPKTGAHVSQF